MWGWDPGNRQLERGERKEGVRKVGIQIREQQWREGGQEEEGGREMRIFVPLYKGYSLQLGLPPSHQNFLEKYPL